VHLAYKDRSLEHRTLTQSQKQCSLKHCTWP